MLDRNYLVKFILRVVGGHYYTISVREVDERELYIEVHKPYENWSDYMSEGTFARYSLWAYLPLPHDIDEYMKRFG